MAKGIDLIDDTLVEGGLRRRRWAADAPLEIHDADDGCQVRAWEDAVLGLHYVELLEPYRGPVEIFFPYPIRPENCPGPDMIRMLAWSVNGDKVSQCMQDGAAAFASAVGRWPKMAYIRKLPQGAEYGVEVDDVMLLELEEAWVVPGFLFIGG